MLLLGALGCDTAEDARLGADGAPPDAGRPDAGPSVPDAALLDAAPPDATRPARPTLLASDRAVLEAFAEPAAALMAAGLPRDEDGLIGRNHTWGALFSPRFQVGAGLSLRLSLAAGRDAEARLAFHGIRAGAEVIDVEGRVPSRLPDELTGEYPLSRADVASAAAFFLGDACLGMLALEEVPELIDEAQRAPVRAALSRGVTWLSGEAEVLQQADADAPNRLLFDALAFTACGGLAQRREVGVHAEAFVAAALAGLADDGHFVEGGGWDTSYQGVALQVAADLRLAGGDAAVPGSALDWLVERVGLDGRVDSVGNRRTCEGGESFLGVPKRLSVASVFRGLAWWGVLDDRARWRTAAGRVGGWALAHPDEDPCWPGAPGAFEPWSPEGVRPPDERLCPDSADPDAAPDKVFIECALDGARYAPPAPSVAPESIRVMAYNLERGFDVDAQIAALRVEAPDVILVSEADRGCARTQGRHIVDDLARALQMDFVYATEFVELRDPPCEHGNAILSRFPLGNARALRHATNDSWFDAPGEPRLGGRVAVVADVQVGAGVQVGSRGLRIYSAHLESAFDDATRTAQAAELAQVAVDAPTAILIGGDLNVGAYTIDVSRRSAPHAVRDHTMRALLDAGFRDAHHGLPLDARITHPGDFDLILDVIAGRGVVFDAPTVGASETYGGLSDHRPISTTVRWR
jgi:endonuclease/exonuclease/phosphatase family metal-dependent hydrolase